MAGVQQTSASTPKLRDSCDACSSSKVRCDKVKPSCGRCVTRGTRCEYVATKRSGRKRDYQSQQRRNTTTATSTNNNTQQETQTRHDSPLSTPPELTQGVNDTSHLFSSNASTMQIPTARMQTNEHQQQRHQDHASSNERSDDSNRTSLHIPVSTVLSPVLPRGDLYDPMQFDSGNLLSSSLLDNSTFLPDSSDIDVSLLNLRDLTHQPLQDIHMPDISQGLLPHGQLEDILSHPASMSRPSTNDHFRDYLFNGDAPPSEINHTRAEESVVSRPPSHDRFGDACCCASKTIKHFEGLLTAHSPDGRDSIEVLHNILQCSCTKDGYVISIMALAIFKILDAQHEALRHMLHRSSQADRLGFKPTIATASLSGDKDEDSDRMAAQLALGQLQRVQQLVNLVATCIDGSGTTKRAQEWELQTAPSLSTLDHLKTELRNRVRWLSSRIIQILRRD